MTTSVLIEASCELINRRPPERVAAKKGDQALGRSIGGLTTKIHMSVDALGRPLKLILTPGQRGDAPLAPALLNGLSPNCVLANKAYDSNSLRLIADMGA